MRMDAVVPVRLAPPGGIPNIIRAFWLIRDFVGTPIVPDPFGSGLRTYNQKGLLPSANPSSDHEKNAIPVEWYESEGRWLPVGTTYADQADETAYKAILARLHTTVYSTFNAGYIFSGEIFHAAYHGGRWWAMGGTQTLIGRTVGVMSRNHGAYVNIYNNLLYSNDIHNNGLTGDQILVIDAGLLNQTIPAGVRVMASLVNHMPALNTNVWTLVGYDCGLRVSGTD